MRKSLFVIFALSECGNCSTVKPALINSSFTAGNSGHHDYICVKRVYRFDIAIHRKPADRAPRPMSIQDRHKRGEVGAATPGYGFKYF